MKLSDAQFGVLHLPENPRLLEVAVAKQFKPNKTFLQKVANGGVMNVYGYSSRKGGYTYFVGGEKMYKAHLAAGYVNHYPGGYLGRPGVVTLTDKGKAALSQ